MDFTYLHQVYLTTTFSEILQAHKLKINTLQYLSLSVIWSLIAIFLYCFHKLNKGRLLDIYNKETSSIIRLKSDYGRLR